MEAHAPVPDDVAAELHRVRERQVGAEFPGEEGLPQPKLVISSLVFWGRVLCTGSSSTVACWH